MSLYRESLPQLSGGLFLTDGGIETTLVFLEGHDLPLFAAFHLLQTADGERALRKCFHSYASLAQKYRTGLILETVTWRASLDWGMQLGYSSDTLAEANRKAVHLLEEFRAQYQSPETPVVISGCVGPRGDGYVPELKMTEAEAADYHRPQILTFAETAADLVTAMTLNYVEEAIGIARAAQQAKMPVVISFTVETDGHLPTGQSLGEAIQAVDQATAGYPAYFMLNCAHPAHFEPALVGDESWLPRIRGLRANASQRSHAELNEATALDVGDPIQLAAAYAALRGSKLWHVNVMGGCCGTDHRHVEEIANACRPLFR